MATRQQAERKLDAIGLELSPDSGRVGNQWSATIDAKGRNSFAGDCRGHVVYDFTATSSEFWAEVISEGERIAPLVEPCSWPDGECDFHDPEDYGE